MSVLLPEAVASLKVDVMKTISEEVSGKEATLAQYSVLNQICYCVHDVLAVQ